MSERANPQPRAPQSTLPTLRDLVLQVRQSEMMGPLLCPTYVAIKFRKHYRNCGTYFKLARDLRDAAEPYDSGRFFVPTWTDLAFVFGGYLPCIAFYHTKPWNMEQTFIWNDGFTASKRDLLLPGEAPRSAAANQHGRRWRRHKYAFHRRPFH